MRIEVLKYKETSLVIDDIERSIREEGIRSDGYEKAIHALKQYIDKTKRSREQLRKAGRSASQINDILYQSPQNIIAFSGRRGTGKTSAMISFTEFLKSRGENSEKSQQLWNREGLTDFYALFLSPIDPTMLENDQDILSVVLSRLLYKAEERWEENPDFHRRNQNLEKDKNELLKKASACLNGIKAVKKKGEINSLSDLQRVGDSAVLKKNLFDLVDLVNRFCLGNDHIKTESSYLVIPIDDTDCQIQKAHDVMEDIRRYLTIPNVLILMATDGDMLRNVFAQHYATEFKTGIDRQILEPIDVEYYAEKYLTKLIPGTHRIYLPVFENVLQGNTVRLELGYYEDEDRDKDLISDSTLASRAQKRNEKDYNDIDFNFQAKILSFIYQKTGIVFFEHTAYINNIIPTTMRGLAHLLNFLHSMDDVEKIDYDREYTMPEIRELLSKRLHALEKNLDLFEEYFMNEWVPAKVARDMVRILKGIQEQVPANLVQYAYDEMYDKYFVKNSNDNPQYPRKPNVSYYDLMEMLGGINGTVNEWGIVKNYKHREDFYNTFAVRTLLTIKCNKQALKTRRRRLDTIKIDEQEVQQWKMDYSDYEVVAPFPTYIFGTKDGEYNTYLRPAVQLYQDLLQCAAEPENEKSSEKTIQKHITVKRRLSSTDKYCMQELSWAVQSNWDVQDIIYKTVDTYRKRTEKTPEGLWEKIYKAIADRNCGMLGSMVKRGRVEPAIWPEDYSKILMDNSSNENSEPKDNSESKDNSGSKENSELKENPAPEDASKTSSNRVSEAAPSNLGARITTQIVESNRNLEGGIKGGLLVDNLTELKDFLVEAQSGILKPGAAGFDEKNSGTLTERLNQIIEAGESHLTSLKNEMGLSTGDSPEADGSNAMKEVSSETKGRIREWLEEVEKWNKDANQLLEII